ncbi:hypothetical protein PWT90_08412 [Aphanocladium album]|nr:hypothetical protein PWT90_08412 [Aphanocladium album]
MQFLSLSVFLSTAVALGINCRGSGICSLNPGASLQVVHDQVGELVAQGGGDRRFSNGPKQWFTFIQIAKPLANIIVIEQIACSHGSQGSFCAFYQSGASGTAKEAYSQLQQLLDHGCGGCGSIPTQPGNDVSKGQLTVNYVSKPCCEGNCHC